MIFLEQFKSDMLLIWRTKGWVVMTIFSLLPLMQLTDLSALYSAKKSSLLTLGLLSVAGTFASLLLGQSVFGAEYGFWTTRFLTKETFKDFFWKRLGTVMIIYATITAIFSGLTFAIRPELWKETISVFYVGMMIFGAVWMFLFAIYSSSIQPIPFESMWLRINLFKVQGFAWQNLILTLLMMCLLMAVGYTFLILEPLIWFIGMIVLTGISCLFAGWSMEFLTKYIYQRRFNIKQKLSPTDK
jgi:hypothetical protein